MEQFVSKLGIDWKLLLSQVVNFTLLLIVLRLFAYKPLLKILKDRKQKIEEGLTKAEEANVRLREVDEIAKGKIKNAEEEALGILKETEIKAKKTEAALLLETRKKEETLIKDAERAAEAAREDARKKVEREAAEVVRRAIVKTVSLDPKAIDEALVKKAVQDAIRN